MVAAARVVSLCSFGPSVLRWVLLRAPIDPARPRAAGSAPHSPREGAARTAQSREALRRSLPGPRGGEPGGGIAARLGGGGCDAGGTAGRR